MRCDKEGGLLYRGLCRSCAPALHDSYKHEAQTWERLFADFTAATGLDHFTNWTAFEEWLDAAVSNPPERVPVDGSHVPMYLPDGYGTTTKPQ